MTTHQAVSSIRETAESAGAGGISLALPGGILGVLVIGALIASAKASSSKSKSSGAKGEKAGDGQDNVLVGLVLLVARFLGGRELSGKARSNARFWRPGAPNAAAPTAAEGATPLAQLGAVGAAGTTTGQDTDAAFAQRWRNRAAATKDRLTAGSGKRRAAGLALWCALVALYSMPYSIYLTTSSTVRTAARWQRWPYGARAAVRLAVVGAAVGWWLDRQQTASLLQTGALLLGVPLLGLIVTGPAGLRLWTGPAYGDDEVFAPSLWETVRRHLNLENEVRETWMEFPRNLRAPDARILIRLPQRWDGSETDRRHLTEAVATRVPGRWRVVQWQLHGDDHWVQWERIPDTYYGPEGTDGPRVGPGLWEAVRPALKLEDAAPQEWLELPTDTSVLGARVTLRLPLGWGSKSGKDALSVLVMERLPGEWLVSWSLEGTEPKAQWRPKPPPLPKPELPTMVPWVPSNDPAVLMLGETHDGPFTVNTRTGTPHWGVSGGTGDGKTTALLIAIVHGRQHRALVDAITMKTQAFEDVEGESGLRVHKSGRAAVAALAEFYVSMKAAEAIRGTEHEHLLRPRIMVIDEFASFVKAAKIWWKHGIEQRGMPPFESWFHMILMQGRSSDHKFVIGAHTFTRMVFGDTETRDLVGTKILVGPYSEPKWTVTYGHVPQVEYDSSIKGRGAVGITGERDIREIQIAYITPEARGHLQACEPAPEWFDRGGIPPWVTDEARAEADEEVAVGDFVPGGKYVPLTAGLRHAISLPRPRSGAVSDTVLTDALTASVTPDEEIVPEVYSLKEACEAGILPIGYGAARQRKSICLREGRTFPEGIEVDRKYYFTAEELAEWWAQEGVARR
jgi:hypothetical protein